MIFFPIWIEIRTQFTIITYNMYSEDILLINELLFDMYVVFKELKYTLILL